MKACTLVEHGVAMFPDAPTARGRRHMKELAELGEEPGTEGHVLLVIMHPDAERFVPSVHTDPEFASTMLAVRDRVSIHAVSVRVSAAGDVRLERMDIPVDLEPARFAGENRGCYLLVARLDRARTIRIGRLGEVRLEAGHYVYVGSARRNLRQRVGRHLRKRKKKRWHIDYFLADADAVRAFPIYSRRDLECALAEELRRLAPWTVPGFGSSDCGCSSHLVGFEKPPATSKAFLELLLRYRHVEALARVSGA